MTEQGSARKMLSRGLSELTPIFPVPEAQALEYDLAEMLYQLALAAILPAQTNAQLTDVDLLQESMVTVVKLRGSACRALTCAS